ncbi:MAG: SufD family Fe-S cluster assembly protein [Gammaproteobacteria bacterium]
MLAELDLKNCILIKLNNYNNNIKIILENNNLFIHIAENSDLNKPIYLVNQKNFKYNITIIIGKSSKVNIIDHKQQQNNTTQIICEPKVILDYYLIQHQDKSDLQIQQYANSLCDFKLLSTNSNNQLNAIIELIGSNSQVKLNILQKISSNYQNSINLLIKHLTTDSYSNTLSRIIADQQAQCNFTGKIIVTPNGKNTNANLQTKGLILNRQASITNSPELIIDNNEVICSHGTSIGNLNPDALFYMQTRGLSIQEATLMLIAAFQQPILNTIKFPEILEYLNI